MSGQQQQTVSDDEQVVAPVESTVTIDTIGAEPDPVEDVEVVANGTEANVSDEHPEQDATNDTVEVVIEDDTDDIEPPTQDEDGKWRIGKYVAEDLPSLFVQVEKGRRHAEKLATKERQAAANENPFLEPEAEDDELDGDAVFTEADLADSLGSGIAQALMQQGLIPQPQQADPQQAAWQSVQIAQRAMQDPASSSEDYQAALYALIQHAPGAVQEREQLIKAWGNVDPAEAAYARFEITQAEREFHAAQQHAMAQQQYEAETTATSAIDEGWSTAQHKFAELNPDWVQHNDGINQWLTANKPMVDAVRMAGDPAANYSLLQNAMRFAQAGVSASAAEHGATVNDVTDTATVEAVAQHRADSATERDLAGLETSVSENVEIVSSQKNPPGLAGKSSVDLFGIPTAS